MVRATVIIVNHNEEKFIEPCLVSVFKSNFKNPPTFAFSETSARQGFEVVVVVNGSTDKSLEIIQNFCKKRKHLGRQAVLKLIKNKTNLGSAEARNQGVRVARGKYLIFFDCDTEIDQNCISEYVKTFEKNGSIGAIHGKLLKMDDKKSFDSSGDFFDAFGFLVDRGTNDSFSTIASGKAASYAIRRDLFKKLGGFDKDFFFLVEETDLDMRVWLSGGKVVFLPKAICYHAFNTHFKNGLNYYSKYLVRYYGPRNYILMSLKNLGTGRMIRVFPLHILALFFMAVLFIFRGKFRDGYYMLKGIFWNITNLPYVLKKRSFVQKRVRKVEDSELDFLYLKSRPVGVYLDKIKSYFKN